MQGAGEDARGFSGLLTGAAYKRRRVSPTCRMPNPMKSTRVLWFLWCFLVFGAFNCYGPPLASYRQAGDPADISAQKIADRMTPLQMLGVLLRNDGDTGRYFSYANAMLGRPYARFYVRPLAGWTKAEPDPAQSAQAWPIVAPPGPLKPWRDFSMEYPPGMAILALLPALLTADFHLYHLLFCLEMELLLTFGVFCGVRAMERLAPGQGRATLLYALACTAALGVIAVRRYDACVSASLGMALLGLATRRPAVAGLSLAFGVISKGAPILMAPLGALYYAAQQRWRELTSSLAAAAGVCFAAAVAFLALAGDHWRDSFAYHGARPLQIESTYAALLVFLRDFAPGLVRGAANSYGSDNLVSAYEPMLRPIAEAAPPLATLAIFVWCWRALRAGTGDLDRLCAVAKAACAIIVAFAALGKVFSPQYLVWLTPVAAMASVQARPLARVVLLVALALSQIEYPFFYTFFAADLPPAFGLLVLWRNAALLLWAGLLLAPRRAPVPVLAPLAVSA
jgi:hypothetical protein